MRTAIVIFLTILTISSFGQQDKELKNLVKSFENSRWKFKSDYFQDYCNINEIYRYDSVLVIKGGGEEGCEQGVMYGININNGKTIWKRNLETYQGDYCFHSDIILFPLENTLHCLDINTGKEKWIFEMPDKASDFLSPFFKDGMIYCLFSNLYSSSLFYSANDSKTNNDSLVVSNLIALDENTGRENWIVEDIGHRQAWKINYINNCILVFISHQAISAFDCRKKQELWRLNQASHPDWSGRGSHFALKDTVVQYRFLYGMGDTIFFGKKVSSIDFHNGKETIIAVDLKSGVIINEFFAGELNKCIMEYDYVLSCVGQQDNILFLKRTNIETKNQCYGYADYSLVCIDMKQCTQKWEYNLSVNDEKYDVRNHNTTLLTDSSDIYLLIQNEIIRFSLKNGEIIWRKEIKSQTASDIILINNYILCHTFSWNNDNYKEISVAFKKDDPSEAKLIKAGWYNMFKDNNKNSWYFINDENEVIQICTGAEK